MLTLRDTEDIDDYAKALDSAFEGRVTVLHRMRLACSFQNKDGSPIDAHCEGP